VSASPQRDLSAYLTGQFDQLTAALAAGADDHVEKIIDSFDQDGYHSVADTVREYMQAYATLRETVTAKDKAAIVDALLRLESLGAIGVTRAMLSAATAGS
jgi:hypothetical protein